MSFTVLNRRFRKRWPPAQSIVKPKTPDDPQGFPDDFAFHFGGALEAVGEDEGIRAKVAPMLEGARGIVTDESQDVDARLAAIQLIERAELDITKLALAHVTDQYLAHIRDLQELAAEDVSAFLVIAAKLLQIKSEALLPRPPVRRARRREGAGARAARCP